MSSVGLEILFIFLLILLNGALSMSEIAIVSARKARLQKKAEEGDASAAVALELANDPDPLLSTVQVGITLVGILAGAFGGATVAEKLGELLNRMTWLDNSGETVAVVLVVLMITYLSVVIGELVPKRLALSRPESIASTVARPMRLLSRLASPAVRLLTASTTFFFGLLRLKPSEEPLVTADEIKVLIRQGTKVGVFEEAEQSMVERVFRLSDRRVNALMTPRTEVVWIDLDDELEASYRKMSESGHTYFPVHRGNRDQILGITSVKRLWGSQIQDTAGLEASLAKPLFIPHSMPAMDLLDTFKKAGTHVALVIDEYGGIQGLITLNDVLGAIVGDVAWSDPDEEPLFVQREDGSWLLDGMLPTDEFLELLGVRPGPDEEINFQSLGGLVMAKMGRIPHAGDHFQWQGLRFEVLDMDARRVDKVLVARLPAQ